MIAARDSPLQYERLRNRTMQIAFAFGGADNPEGEVKDDKLVEMLRRLLDDRNAAKEQLQAARAELDSKGSFRSELTEAVRGWAEHLAAMQVRCSALRSSSESRRNGALQRA